MPKTKKERDSSGSESDSGPEDRNPSKKSKTSDKKASTKDPKENSWSIGKTRFIKINEFKGKIQVDIREYYDADGELKPGRKGISLNIEQWNNVKNCIEEVDEAIKRLC